MGRSLPAFWSECRPLKVDEDLLDGRAMWVFMTKGVVVKSVSEMNATHQAQRAWQSKMIASFGDYRLRAEQLPALALGLNHGYVGSASDHEMILSLMQAHEAENIATLSDYYKHCRSVQRDLTSSSEQDLDYLDLFGDSRRAKMYVKETVQGVEISYTMACAADCLRLHPSLMVSSWDCTHASRDACSVWETAATDVNRFQEMLDADGADLRRAEDRIRLTPRSKIVDGKLFLNYTANFLWIGRCRGELATSLRLRGAALKAFAEVGLSSAVRAVLAKALDPGAAGLRAELDPNGQQLQTWLDDNLKVALLDLFESQQKQWQQVLVAREEHWEQVVVTMEGQWQDVVQQNRCEDQEWRRRWWECVEGWRTEAAALVVSVKNLPFNLGQKIADVVTAAVMSPGSLLIKNLRAATKKTAVRSTHSARRFPSSQKATQLEVLSLLVSLLSVAIRFFPEMNYDTWKAVRSNFGKAVKKAKLQRHALGEDSAEYIDRPLLWSFVGEGTAEGGGQRYVLLREYESLADAVWTVPRSIGSGRRRRVESFDAAARRLQASALQRPGYEPAAWPLLSAEVEPDFGSSSDEG